MVLNKRHEVCEGFRSFSRADGSYSLQFMGPFDLCKIMTDKVIVMWKQGGRKKIIKTCNWHEIR